MEPGPVTLPKLPPILDQNLCVQVFTHETWNGLRPSADEEPKHNGRLVWIGAPVLELAISDKLFSTRSYRSNDDLTVRVIL
jgi:dsRNA-specific ribonuclease